MSSRCVLFFVVEVICTKCEPHLPEPNLSPHVDIRKRAMIFNTGSHGTPWDPLHTRGQMSMDLLPHMDDFIPVVNWLILNIGSKNQNVQNRVSAR